MPLGHVELAKLDDAITAVGFLGALVGGCTVTPVPTVTFSRAPTQTTAPAPGPVKYASGSFQSCREIQPAGGSRRQRGDDDEVQQRGKKLDPRSEECRRLARDVTKQLFEAVQP